MGAQLGERDGVPGAHFSVWAPAAAEVAVAGTFNGWSARRDPLARVDDTGVWSGFVPGVTEGAHYKFHIRSRIEGATLDKADPFAFAAELPPNTASIVHDPSRFVWRDEEWMRARAERNAPGAPISIYEVHLGSWRRVREEGEPPPSPTRSWRSSSPPT